MLYEALVVFVIVGFIILTTLNLNTMIIKQTKDLEKNINLQIARKYQKIKDCDSECLIKKALWQ